MINNIRFKIIAGKITELYTILPEKNARLHYIIKQRDRGQAEAKCLRPRPKLRGQCRRRSRKFWSRGHFGLEDLTSLQWMPTDRQCEEDNIAHRDVEEPLVCRHRRPPCRLLVLTCTTASHYSECDPPAWRSSHCVVRLKHVGIHRGWLADWLTRWPCSEPTETVLRHHFALLMVCPVRHLTQISHHRDDFHA